MLFSILMCTYNSDSTLKNAIESLKLQTYKDWELIVIDNASKDNTVAILEEYASADKRIKCTYNKENVGWCKGISDCLKITNGEYMMFLGADDIVSYIDTFQDIANEIKKHNEPDIIWTGNYYADLKNGEYKILSQCIPEYKSYKPFSKEERLEQIVYIMKNVYYNSVMHYVKIDFLRKNNIDFFEPYYSDCQGMTEAMCKADSMVLLDKTEYILVCNTSQTSQAVIFDYNLAEQWKSIQSEFVQLMCDDRYREKFQYIGDRIACNMVSILKSIVSGSKLRDLYMNPINIDYVERFIKVEEWLSNKEFIEMLDYAGRSRYINEILFEAAVTLYTHIVVNKFLIEKVCKESKWLVHLIVVLFYYDNTTKLRSQLSESEFSRLKEIINIKENVNKIGTEYIS